MGQENKKELIKRCDEQLKMALCGLIYTMDELNYFHEFHKEIKEDFDKKNDFRTSKKNLLIWNSILEAAIYNLRKMYEFFFYLEMNADNKIECLVGNLNSENNKENDTVVAEYFFEKADKWQQIKIDSSISWIFFNRAINKDKINKKAMHFTFQEKADWDNLPCVIEELNRVYNVFFKHQKYSDFKYENCK